VGVRACGRAVSSGAEQRRRRRSLLLPPTVSPAGALERRRRRPHGISGADGGCVRRCCPMGAARRGESARGEEVQARACSAPSALPRRARSHTHTVARERAPPPAWCVR